MYAIKADLKDWLFIQGESQLDPWNKEKKKNGKNKKQAKKTMVKNTTQTTSKQEKAGNPKIL